MDLSQIESVYLGSTKIGGIYKGGSKVWPLEEFDPYWSDVKLLLQFDGSSLTDSKTGTSWRSNGTISYNTLNPISGLASLELNSGAYIYIPSGVTLNWSNSPWTIEFTVKMLETITTGERYLLWSSLGANTDGRIDAYLKDGDLVSAASNDYNNPNWVYGPYLGTINSTYHVAIVRDNTPLNDTLRLFVNGLEQDTNEDIDGETLQNSDTFSIGNTQGFSGFNGPHALYDKIRVTVGVARYTTNYVVSTDPFPTK